VPAPSRQCARVKLGVGSVDANLVPAAGKYVKLRLLWGQGISNDDALSEATQPFEYVAVAEGAQGGRNLRIELFGCGDMLDGLDVGEIAGKLVHKRRQFVFLGRK